jgi:hypothetical protein
MPRALSIALTSIRRVPFEQHLDVGRAVILSQVRGAAALWSDDLSYRFSYSSWRRHQRLASLRPSWRAVEPLLHAPEAVDPALVAE